ncbi:MAG: response regulator [Gammaproteobacteria bacterium]|nr:response regulator [Gammaproteobacteria bacterium]
MIVDDEVSVANFLRELLEHSGYDTTVFNDPEAALAFLHEHVADVHLVITDQTMPRLSGTEFARRIAELPKSPPVILCTRSFGSGHRDPVDIAAVLAKPFEIPELLREVARHL